MSLGFHAPLVPDRDVAAFSRGLRTAALVLVLGAILSGFSTAGALSLSWRQAPIVILDLVALLGMVLLLAILKRTASLGLAVLYLTVGAIAVYLTTLAMGESPRAVFTNLLSLSFVKIALILVSSANGGMRRAQLWCSGGFIIAEVSSALAQLAMGDPYRFDSISFAAYIFIFLVLLLGWFSQGGGLRAQPLFEKAARDELIFDLRHRIELNAAALLHDTILNNLAVIATALPGPLSAKVRAQLALDLETLSGEEWMTPVEPLPAIGDDLWRQSPLNQAVFDGRAMGLTVEVTGDLPAVYRVSPEAGVALGLAVKQCLANVALHSGSNWAEVTVHASAEELLVMVVDTGRGFVELEVGADRLGLRTSVRQRIATVGGTVQIWSTPGRGTSVVIRIPIDQPSDLLVAGAPVSEDPVCEPHSAPPRVGGVT
ncbi:MAG: ATP-binding protein [Microbacteriaceae bacterium]|nr:ATP-binding protein [Microbacteriaceae bacterium]